MLPSLPCDNAETSPGNGVPTRILVLSAKQCLYAQDPTCFINRGIFDHHTRAVRALHPNAQFCGDYKGDADPIQDRLLEFATKYCGNRAFRSMLDAVFCTPLSEFCDAEHAVGASS